MVVEDKTTTRFGTDVQKKDPERGRPETTFPYPAFWAGPIVAKTSTVSGTKDGYGAWTTVRKTEGPEATVYYHGNRNEAVRLRHLLNQRGYKAQVAHWSPYSDISIAVYDSVSRRVYAGQAAHMWVARQRRRRGD